MDYVESLRYLYGLADFERSGRFADRPDVAPVYALLHELGDPHLGRATVHIAGSKGKGSVAAMVESMVRAAGYTTGLFTSPHLHRFPERIQISDSPSPRKERGLGGEDAPSPENQSNNQTINDPAVAKPAPSGVGAVLTPVTTGEFAAGVTEVAAAVERVRAAMPDRVLVTFDVLTALGFLLFRQHAVEVQVIEVGLGGLLDSTNVFGGNLTPRPPLPAGRGGVSAGSPPLRGDGEGVGGEVAPLVTVITNIGLEHREILGDTVPEIARQKAGIIVPGAPVIMAPQRESAAEVIREVAAEKGAPLTEVALACNLRRDQAGMDHQTFRLRTQKNGYTIKLPLLGKHQLDNAATAVLAVEALAEAMSLGAIGGRQSTEIASPLPPVDGSQRRGPGQEDATSALAGDESTEIASPLPPVDGSQRQRPGQEDATSALAGDESAEGASPLPPVDGSQRGIGVEAVQKGLEGVRWPGRIEILRRRPLLIVDSAHTADSARRLRDTLAEYLRIDQATLVVGVMGDKDLEGLMMAIEPVARRVIATQADHPRALAAEKVARVFRDRSIETYVEPKLGAAIDMAQSLSTGSDAVVILGSIALAGEARAHVLGLERDPPV